AVAALAAALVGVLLTAGAASAAPVAAAAPRVVAGAATLADHTQAVSARALTPLSGRVLDAPTPPDGPSAPTSPSGPSDVTVKLPSKPSTSLNILLLVTLLSVAPSLLLLVTSFTKIFVVLSLTRNALGLSTVPPNQVLAGLSLFLSLFVMEPVLSKVNKLGIQPYLHGTKTRSQAWTDGIKPLREFMLAHTRPEEIALMLRAAHMANPSSPEKLQLTTIIPAFVLSELRAAMIIGFIVYIPFVIIDLVVSSSLMSLGMMMLPPVSVSLPFKLLLFVLVDGWGLIVTSLVQSYNTT
ncbi:MAG: flagellar type III secretion system pore protein FliP, partial [Jatrophihabitans sp.]|uniref:flagellar type III secretion system pore protein FliP n=1 Tax=Jatrophihabitans sp. TaxID=1932789 RepID=UPI003F7D8A6E